MRVRRVTMRVLTASSMSPETLNGLHESSWGYT